jgi:hypothetical protein
MDVIALQVRRWLTSYQLKSDSTDSLRAIADLGLAELYVRSKQIPEAQAAMKDTLAVPEDF